MTFIHAFIFAAAVTLTKISVLLLYARIFGLSHGNFRTNLWATGAVTVAYPLTVMVGLLVSCQPLSFYWTRFAGDDDGRCILDTELFFVVLAIVNLVINVWILVIPIPQILKLQMSARNKAAVCGLMLLGGLYDLRPLSFSFFCFCAWFILLIRLTLEYTQCLRCQYYTDLLFICLGILGPGRRLVYGSGQ